MWMQLGQGSRWPSLNDTPLGGEQGSARLLVGCQELLLQGAGPEAAPHH